MKTYIIMSNVFNRGGIINERKINIKGCCKQLLDTYIYAISDEIHQGITGEGRSPRIFDVYIDTLGTATGSFVMLLITHLINLRKSNTKS